MHDAEPQDAVGDRGGDRPERNLGDRHAPEKSPDPGRDLVVRAREDPDRRALEDADLLHDRSDRWQHLDCRGASSDQRNPLAGEVMLMVPTSGVQDLAGELLHALDVRHSRVGQRAAAAEDEARANDPTGGVQFPHVLLLVPDRALHVRVQADSGTQAVLVDEPIGVRLQLMPGSVGSRPVRVGLEGQRVVRRRDVDGDARIGAVPPRPPDVVSPLDHREVDSGLGELDPRADPGEPGPHHGDLVINRPQPVARHRVKPIQAARSGYGRLGGTQGALREPREPDPARARGVSARPRSRLAGELVVRLRHMGVVGRRATNRWPRATTERIGLATDGRHNARGDDRRDPGRRCRYARGRRGSP